MTSTGGEQDQGQEQGGGGGGGLLGTLTHNPAVSRLGEAARDYAKARGSDAAPKIGDKRTGVTGSLNDTAEDGGFKPTAVGEAAKRVAQGDSPVKAALGGV